MTYLLAITLIACNFGLTVENPADTGDPYGGETRIDGDDGGPSGGGSPGDDGGPGGGSPGGDDSGSGPGTSTDDTGGTTNEGDGGSGPGGDTTTEPPANNPPDVLWFEANEDANNIVFEFDVDDIDGDMTGGSVTISVGSTSEDYTFPTEVPGSSGNYRLSWSALDFDRERSYTASIRAQDSAGHNSSAISDSFERGPWTISVAESGDNRTDSVVTIGAIELPAEIHGNIYAADNDGRYYTEDQDWVKFRAPATGNLDLTLSWVDGSADYDLFLADEAGAILSSQTSPTFGESLSFYVNSGENYLFGVTGWEGSGSDWTVRIE